MTFHLVVPLDAVVGRELFRAAFPGRDVFVLEGGGTSLMGAEPAFHVRASRRDGGDPFAGLRAHLHAAPGELDPAFPFPFRAGLVGYVGYECGQMLERLPCVARPGLDMPDLAFAFHRWVLGTRNGRTWLSVVEESRAAADAIRERVLTRIANADVRAPRACAASGPLYAWLDRDAYVERVRAAREHIRAGDAFEICLTNAFDAPLARENAWPLFRALQHANPAPFAAFLDLDEGTIVSSSPERFLSLDAQRVAETRPIKGTRPRGETQEEDARLAAELASSEKDRAENAMIVDLARNDLGRVCTIGSVTTPELYAVESYATVHQLVSTVRGELAHEHDAIDLLRACFPPGSMTGAPKIEAMSILERLEPVERGPYAGALGWIDVGGAMDLSVVIRAAVFAREREGQVRFAAGGAVTADSDPHAEHEEMLQKTRALRSVLG